MKKINFSLTTILSLLLIFFFLSPFLILFFNFQLIALPDFEDLLWAFKNSFYQALFSTIIALFVGVLFVDGIFYFHKKIQNKALKNTIDFLFILPSFLPAIFTLLIFLSVFQPFPYGIFGISIVHGLTYAGLFALMLTKILNSKAKGLFETSYLLGVQRIQIYIEACKMVKSDIIAILVFIFTICFTSFSIPIAIGGGNGTTLEILIYEKMRLSGNWSEAFILSVIQSLIIGFVSLFFLRKNSFQLNQKNEITVLGSLFSILPGLLYISFFVFGFLFYSFGGWQQVLSTPELWSEMTKLIPTTVAIGILSGVVTFLFFMLASFSVFHQFLNRFLLIFVTPSISLIGLSIILLAPRSDYLEFTYYIFASMIAFFCGLYKLGFEQALNALAKQVEIAQQLGSGAKQILLQIVYPQVIPLAFRLSGIAALWTVGDFALCKVIFTRNFLFAQLIEDLMAAYRIESATSMMGLLMFIGFMLYLLFAGVGYVYSQRFNKRLWRLQNSNSNS